MCGLTGVMSSTLSLSEENIFRDLFTISALRGFQGSGVAVVQADQKVRSFKTLAPSGVLARSGELEDLLKPQTSAIIGHARWPTKGAVDAKSAHPHRHKHIIGVHNGTLYKVAGERVKDGESDSSLLFKAIAELGIEKAIKDTDGAYALVWVDEKERTFNFLRNGQRTLFFKNVGWQKNINTMFWSSEESMLDFVFARSHKGQNTWNTFLPTDTLYKYPLDVHHIIRCVETVQNVKPEVKTYIRGYTKFSDYDASWEDYISGKGMYGEDQTPKRENAVVPFEGGRRASPITPRDIIMERQRRAREQYEERRAREEAQREAMAKATEAPATEDMFPKHELREPIDDIGRGVTERYRKLDGCPCAWCGEVATPGQKVYVVSHSDLGTNQFICWDCGTHNDGCEEFVRSAPVVTVIN